MGEFQSLVQVFDRADWDVLAATNMGDLNLRPAVDLLRRTRDRLAAADVLEPLDIPMSVRGEVLGQNFRNEVTSLLDRMADYGPSTDNPAQARRQYLVEAVRLSDLVLERVVPITRTDETTVRRAMEEVRDLSDRLRQTQTEFEHSKADLEKQQAVLAQSSASTAAADLSTYYESQAKKHAGTARSFFVSAVAAAIVLTVLTLWFLFWSPPDYSAASTSQQWIEVTRNSIARLALLSIVGYAVAFCVRNYRVNMHLEVLNKRRENALNTFGLMQAGVTTDDARNIVVGELVRAVFTSDETGYLGAETERTVIESPGGAGMLSAVAAAARNAQS